MQNYRAAVRLLSLQRTVFFEEIDDHNTFCDILNLFYRSNAKSRKQIITISNLFKLCPIFSFSHNIMKNKHTIPLP